MPEKITWVALYKYVAAVLRVEEGEGLGLERDLHEKLKYLERCSYQAQYRSRPEAKEP